jgi:CBS domain containing-hemolysin-like protein
MVILAMQNLPPLGTLLGEALFFVLLVVVSGFVAGSEVALIGFSKLRRRQLVEEKHPRIGAVEKLMEKPQRFLITILIVNTLVNILAASVATAIAESIFGSLGVAIATGVVTLLMLTFGEITPKAYASAHGEGWALGTAPILLGMMRLLWPLVRAYEKLMDSMFKSMGASGDHGAANFRSEEEIKTLITVGAEEGVLEEKEEDMLHSVIEFGETVAKEIMVPRIDMVAVPGDATVEHIRAFALDSGFSRIPVYQGTVDNVVGILYVKDLLLHLLNKGNPAAHVRDLMHDAFFVPESKKLDDLLTEMREKRMHMAVVIDEFGGTAGLVTLEDVLEEVVGDIFDEYDLRSEPVRQLDDRTAIVDARTHVADVNDALEIEIPEEEGYDTVAGYIYDKLGRLGKEGEVVHGPGFDMVVEKVSNRRILRARVVKHKSPVVPAEGEEASAP